MKKDKKKLIVIIFVIIIVFVAGYILYFKLPEIQARRVVDKHLQSIKTGRGDPYDTVDITKVKSIFINVIDFKYLNTLLKERVLNDPMVFNRKWYEKYEKERFNSYEKFLQFEKDLYGNRAKEAEDGLIIESNDYHYEFIFLYDVTITNRLGEKLYKKYLFEVKQSSISDHGYAITSFEER